MNTVILELSVEEIPQVKLPVNGIINIHLLGIDYEVKLEQSIMGHGQSDSTSYYCSSINYDDHYQTYLGNRKLMLRGYAVDKKAKELSEAKAAKMAQQKKPSSRTKRALEEAQEINEEK